MKTPLITTEGYAKLKHELDYLWLEYRPEITKIVQWAASLGDRSENADYQYNKRLLRQIDSRIRYLRKVLEQVTVVAHAPEQNGRIFFGAWVEVSNDNGDHLRLRIVGPDEISAENKEYISIDSPMARAMLKKRVDDSFDVTTAHSTTRWYIENIWYQPE